MFCSDNPIITHHYEKSSNQYIAKLFRIRSLREREPVHIKGVSTFEVGQNTYVQVKS